MPFPLHIYPFAAVNIFSIALACALTCGIAGAQAAEPQGPAAELRAQMLSSLHGGVAPAFVLDKDLPLDPALRAEADKLSAEHLARVDKLLPAWLDEERTRQTRAGKAPASTAVYFAVLARLLNELSLWQLEPGDAHYESTTLAVLRGASTVCDLSGDYRLTDFASRILRIQALPAAERKAMLAGERELRRAAAWGLAIRLGQRLSGGVAGPLERAQLRREGEAVALMLDEDTARQIQLQIEYDPERPFPGGTPRTSPEHIVQRCLEAARKRYAIRADAVNQAARALQTESGRPA